MNDAGDVLIRIKPSKELINEMTKIQDLRTNMFGQDEEKD